MAKLDPIYGRNAHTPGPWEASRMRLGPNEKDRRSGVVINGPEPKGKTELPTRICDMRTGDKSYTEMQANANLIAAAPDLLEACRYVVNWHRENDSGEGELFGLDFVTTCISAIAKATE